MKGIIIGAAVIGVAAIATTVTVVKVVNNCKDKKESLKLGVPQVKLIGNAK